MGPLEGLTVVEVAGAGPTPFCGMVLADLGADVVRVDRVVDRAVLGIDPDMVMGRGKRSVGVDLKQPEGVEVVLRLAERADVLVEGYRPGVSERLGIGPDACLARNPRLVYARGTGFGQTGPLAPRAGHDIDYIAVAGVLHPIGPPSAPPVPPLSLVGDFGGGGMLLALGVMCAVFETARSGQGQVVDAAMVDGAALLATTYHELRAVRMWSDERGANILDGSAPFYGTYETSDGRYVAVGALEPQFWAELARMTGIDDGTLPDQLDRARWPELRERLAAAFRTRTRDEWAEIGEETDACLVPVLEMHEAATHPYNTERNAFVDVNGSPQPAPAPRFSRTVAAAPRTPPKRGEHTDEVLARFGFTPAELERLHASATIG